MRAAATPGGDTEVTTTDTTDTPGSTATRGAAAIVAVGAAGAGLIGLAWLLRPGPLALIVALTTSVAATALAVVRVTRSSVDAAQTTGPAPAPPPRDDAAPATGEPALTALLPTAAPPTPPVPGPRARAAAAPPPDPTGSPPPVTDATTATGPATTATGPATELPVSAAVRATLLVAAAPAAELDLAGLGLTSRELAAGAGPTLPPYVARDLDPELDRALGSQLLAPSGGFVAVRGRTGSGRTRSVVEALRRTAPYRPVLVVRTPRPDDPRTGGWPLERLLSAVRDGGCDAVSRPVVLIDDAERHLGRGLDRDRLVDLGEAVPGAAVVAVLDRDRLLVPDLVADPTEAWLRAGSAELELADELTDTELARAFERFPASALDGRLRWLPTWLAGADVTRAGYRDLRTTDPARAGVLTAAALRALVDDTTTAPRDQVAALATTLLAAARPPVELGSRRLTGYLGALTASDQDRVEVAPVLLAEVRERLASVPAEVWEVLVGQVDPTAAALTGRLAAAAGHEQVAVQALSRAADSDQPELATHAALSLGVLLERLERPEAAVAAYRRVVASDDVLRAPLAAFHLGGVLETIGELDEAAETYRWAVATEHADAAPLAAFNLGWLAEQRQDPGEAERWYREAIESGHREAAPQAAYNLGWVLQQQRRLKEAEDRYRLALASDHPDVAPMAAVGLGVLLERLQRTREARGLLERAAASGHAEAAQAARLRLQTARRAPGGGRR